MNFRISFSKLQFAGFIFSVVPCGGVAGADPEAGIRVRRIGLGTR